VVDAARTILDANQRAKDLLAGQHGIEDCGGVLKTKRASLCRTIAQLVQWAAGAEAGFGVAADIVGIPDDCGRTRFAVRVLPCHYLGSPGALIVINDMLSEIHASRGTLARLFSLSAREAEFADRFASGARVEQIASDMAISTNTARIHLRHLFLKTGCKTQAELARLFAKVP
jgi:DNA-binding CsgD family transcriptional regulator